LCEASGSILYADVRDRLFGVPGNWAIRECTNTACGLLWLEPRPTLASVAEFYKNYYTHGDEAIGATRSLTLRSLAGRLFALVFRCAGVERLRDDFVRLGLAHVEPGRLLEIGCGNGSRMSIFARRGWVVEGQEIDPDAARVVRARGHRVHEGLLENVGLQAETYDVVIADHVIEHVIDPLSLVRECYRVLKPGGRIILAAPNTGSVGHARFGEYWVGLDVPRHLWGFRLSSLSALLAKAHFHFVQGRSTAANAEFFFAVSEEIRLRGSANMLEARSVRAGCVGKAGQLTSLWHWRRNPHSGEECVVSAVKPLG
jgi:SAM-dependent methyltransferase